MPDYPIDGEVNPPLGYNHWWADDTAMYKRVPSEQLESPYQIRHQIFLVMILILEFYQIITNWLGPSWIDWDQGVP